MKYIIIALLLIGSASSVLANGCPKCCTTVINNTTIEQHSSGGGMSLHSFVRQAEKYLPFWGMLDKVFVSHAELETVQERMDKLEAENMILRFWLRRDTTSWPYTEFDCQVAKVKASRLNNLSIYNGWYAQPGDFQCVKVG